MKKQLAEYLLLIGQHLTKDISFGGQGTFNNYNEKTGEYNFDAKEAKMVIKGLNLIAKELSK